jgi:hypothetical protein
MSMSYRVFLLASFLAIVGGDAARATPVGMPAGSTVWMELDGNACDSDGDSDCLGSNQPGPNPPNGIPLTTFSESNGTWVTGFAEVYPDQVRSLVSGHSGAFLYISMLDTYTVHGTAEGAFSSLKPSPPRTASSIHTHHAQPWAGCPGVQLGDRNLLLDRPGVPRAVAHHALRSGTRPPGRIHDPSAAPFSVSIDARRATRAAAA